MVAAPLPAPGALRGAAPVRPVSTCGDGTGGWRLSAAVRPGRGRGGQFHAQVQALRQRVPELGGDDRAEPGNTQTTNSYPRGWMPHRKL